MIEGVEHLCLHGVEIRELVELLVTGVLESRHWQRVQVQQVGVGRVDLGQDEVLEGYGHD